MSNGAQVRLKGRFSNKRKIDNFERCAEMGKSNKKRKEEEEDNPENFPVEGHRIVDVKHLAENMICSCCKAPLLIQNIRSETLKGLASIFDIFCENCLLINKVASGKQQLNPVSGYPLFNVNTKAAIAALHAGCGATKTNKFLRTIDIPGMSAATYKLHERIVGPVIESVAKETCAEAVILERIATVDNIEELKKMLPEDLKEGFLIVNMEPPENDLEKRIVRIFVSYDMAWSQRSNGYKYDSLNGFCAIIGLNTGKVLDFCTRNRKCATCDAQAKSGKIIHHDCRLNFYGSAKAMEADGAVQLCTKSNILKEANVEVGVFIGDNDSSSLAAIQQASDHKIVKQCDMNHSKKGVGKALYQIKGNKSMDPDGELTCDAIKYLQDCFSNVVKKNKGNVIQIESDLRNVANHVFDKHDSCGSFCKFNEDQENYDNSRHFKNSVLYESIKSVFEKLAQSAGKFSLAGSSQANESLNNAMSSHCPKSHNYSTTESADYRFACTVAQKNIGDDYLLNTFEQLNLPIYSSTLTRNESGKQQALKRYNRESIPAVKKQRRLNELKRSQLRNRLENSEDNTYSSNMTLFENSSNDQCTIEILSNYLSYNSLEIALVFFDIETGGFHISKDILQIAMIHEKFFFSTYITPTRSIDSSASKVNGLTKVGKQLFYAGNSVPTLSRKIAAKKIVEYLKMLNKKCVLIAHNCNFDARRLITFLKECSLLEEFEQVVHGFTDTLALFKKLYPKRKTGYKLSVLAHELMSLPCDGAHNAKVDIQLLEKLAINQITVEDLIKNSKYIEDIVQQIDLSNLVKENVKKLLPLKKVISQKMLERLAEKGIDYDAIFNKYKDEGEEATVIFLKGESKDKPTLIKTKKVLQQILNHLKSKVE